MWLLLEVLQILMFFIGPSFIGFGSIAVSASCLLKFGLELVDIPKSLSIIIEYKLADILQLFFIPLLEMYREKLAAMEGCTVSCERGYQVTGREKTFALLKVGKTSAVTV